MGRAPEFDYQIEERFSFGEVQILFTVREGIVTNVDVFSDALDTELANNVNTALKNSRFSPEEMYKKLLAFGGPEMREIADYVRIYEF